MGKRLAIRGHSTRGKEVINLLEMLGGKNTRKLDGSANMYSYYIFSNTILSDRLSILEDDDYEIFTLQGFLEKFPFKVGDRVLIPEYESEVRICKMRWDPLCEYVEYMVYRCDDEEWYTAEELLDYNDNPNEPPKAAEEKKINQMSLANCDLDEVEIVLGDRFELKTKDGKYYAVRKKSKYPTTYKECCKIVNACHTVSISYDSNEDMLYNDEVDLTILALRKLIICRNAYWKIAGEEMGLGKPWKPNEDSIIAQYGIRPLLFPSKEIYNMFYDNFKDLIEQCKELL